MHKETGVFEGKARWHRGAYLKLEDNKVIFDCSDDEYGPIEFDISILIEAINKHSKNDIFTYPENVPAEIMNPILEDVARQVTNWENAKNMDYKERYNQIIDEVYESYKTEWMKENPPFAGPYTDPCLTQDEFINKCKTDSYFSEKWGLKIEERELNRDEKLDLYISKYDAIDGFNYNQYKHTIPTKLITLTYNNETVESYE